MSGNGLQDALDAAATALLQRAFPDSGRDADAGGTEKPSLNEQVKVFDSVSAWFMRIEKLSPEKPKGEAPFEKLRRQQHGSGPKR